MGHPRYVSMELLVFQTLRSERQQEGARLLSSCCQYRSVYPSEERPKDTQSRKAANATHRVFFFVAHRLRDYLRHPARVPVERRWNPGGAD
jgi:hypothetical protein